MRIKALLVSLVFALCAMMIAQAAVAQSARGVIIEEDVVEEVNTALGTVVIAGETFQVESGARVEDPDGKPISIREIRATKNHGEGDFVKYVLAGRGDVRTVTGLRSIQSLQVLGGDYE